MVSSRRHCLAVRAAGDRLSTVCLLLLGLSRLVSDSPPANGCLSGICSRYADWLLPIDAAGRSRPQLCLVTCNHFKATVLLLLLCGDIATNPGPNIGIDIPDSVDNRPVVGSANVCGLRGKVLHFQAEFLESSKFAAFALQETKLPKNCKDAALQIPNYSLFRKDRSGSGGGVALYVQDSLHPRPFRTKPPASLELVATETYFGTRRIILASVYLPPRSRPEMEERISDLVDWIAQIGTAAQDLVLLGDLNLCPLDRRQSWQSDVISQFCQTFGLYQVIQQPTHNERLIDHCFLGDRSLFAQCGLAPTLERKKRGKCEGHAVIWIQLHHLKSPKPQPVSFSSWNWADFDFNHSVFELCYTQDGQRRNLVAEMWSCGTVDSAAQFLTDELLRILHLTCPQRVVRFKHYASWITRNLLRLIQRKHVAWRHFKRDRNNHQLMSRWRHLCARVRTEVRLAKEAHMAGQFEKVDSINSFWAVIRKVTNQHQSASIPALRLVNGSYVTSNEQKAQALADSLAQNYNSSTVLPLPVFPRLLQVDREYLCSADFVRTHLQRLRPNDATGLDKLPAMFLRSMAIPLAPVVTALINRCILEGSFPLVWKRSRVTAIPKVPGTQDVSEFRPITITPILSKLAERWILVLLEDHLDTHNHQFGFKSSSGTEEAIVFAEYSLEKVLSSCSGVKKAAVISLDISKAFDQCPFAGVIQALNDRSVPDPVLRLLCSYFTNRTQAVKSGQALSLECPIPSGIGQGTVLAPFLFNVFIDEVFSLDLHSKSTLVGYADDLLVVAPCGSDSEVQCLQEDLISIAAHYNRLGLKLNPAKSKVMLCAVSPQANFDGVFFSLYGHPLSIVSELKYLGVYFSQNLSFDYHTDYVANRAKKTLGALFSVCSSLSKDNLLYLYCTKIRPILLYALPVSCPTTKRGWLTLEHVNRFACRLLLNDFSSSYSALLESLNLDSLQKICLTQQLKLCYKYVRGIKNFPVSLAMPESVENHSAYNLRHRYRPHCYQVPLPTLPRLATLPIFIAFASWNKLDENAVLLDIRSFLLYLKSSSVYDTVVQRLKNTDQRERFYFSVDFL